jgi:hypothetical protein
VFELPADLLLDGFWPVRVRKGGGFDGMSGGAQRVRAHVADGDALTGCSSSGRCRRSLYVTRTDATGKATANLLSSV